MNEDDCCEVLSAEGLSDAPKQENSGPIILVLQRAVPAKMRPPHRAFDLIENKIPSLPFLCIMLQRMPTKPKKTTTKKPASKPRKRAPKKSSALPIEGAAAPHVVTGATGKKILVCDDDPALSRVLGLKFQNAGFDVMVCHNGEQGVEALKQTKFDGIILDLIMPGKTGFDVLSEKKQTMNKGTPVFVMSDMRTQETIDTAMSLGATDFFVKMQMPLKEVIESIASRT